MHPNSKLFDVVVVGGGPSDATAAYDLANVQKLTWDAYMNKELVRAKPIAYIRIFFKNLAHMAGLASA